jgi:Mn-dependent DtxR family transcriptional regulator
MSMKTGELAELLGTTVYSVSHILREMTDKGYLIKLGNSKYVVIEPSIAAWNPEGDKSAQESMF